MTRPEYSLEKLDRAFVIPVGTQVVLRAGRPMVGVEGFKQAGSVGVVVESPPHNSAPYLVQFTDGQAVQAMSEELSLRRREIDDLLGEWTFDPSPYVIYRCQVGSRAFGLATDASDDDIRGVVAPPGRLDWSLRRVPEQWEGKIGQCDFVLWEIEKFVRLALKANPSVLEALWTPLVLDANEIGQELLAIRPAFLSQHIYRTYSGYAISQFRRMANAFRRTGEYKPKHAMHLIRLLRSGIEALRTGEIVVDVSHLRHELMPIRSGELTFDEVQKMALKFDAVFQQALEKTSLPETPDIECVDRFLISVRRRMADAAF